ncbi:hypothetical protein JQ633_07155 [Bradyrhizobium tropiciagri]|uniref:alpha/beta fold hydrolase n=1 Tax=Bradyrhizobium tropiciagri TaxID=312253 RepID=UPI001BA9A848|nr:hypothetical protein [Bradyrhizobium tropiciagri]MBR0870128.1 hypothetical protein [Bradyrhizobium tropiciagri]
MRGCIKQKPGCATHFGKAAPLQPFSAIRADTLLLGGGKSPQFLRTALDALAGVLPRAARIEPAKADHIAADNVGKPELVARKLRSFFGQARSVCALMTRRSKRSAQGRDQTRTPRFSGLVLAVESWAQAS